MSKVAMVIKTKTLPGKREEVRQLYEKHLAPRAQANAAQELVLWCADEMDADTFYLFEVYRDQAATQANAQASWFWDYMKEVQPLLAGQPEVALATPLWAKGFVL